MLNNISDTVKCYSLFCNGQNNAFNPDKFNDIFPGIKAYYEWDFFLVCNRYSITINKKQAMQGNLNIFERTILKLLRLANFTDEELAAKMGVEKDFVNFIRLSLIERGYIDSENRILKKLDNCYVKESRLSVLTLKNSDILLPIVIEDEKSLIDAGVDTNQKVLYLVDSDSAGRYKPVKRNYYSYDKKSNTKNGLRYPSKTGVLSIIRSYYKWDKNIKLSCYSSVDYEGDVFVHFKAVVQNNKADAILVSEGDSYTNNDVISLIKEKDINFFDRIISNAYQHIENKQRDNKIEYAFYPNLKKLLSDISLFEGQTVSERERAANNYNEAIYKMYGALEWGLHYYLSQLNIQPIYKKILYDKNNYLIGRMSLKCAQKMGFRNIEHKSINLLSMTNGYSIKNYFMRNYKKTNTNKFSPNLKVLLPLCLIMSNYTNDKIWYKIAREFPYLFGDDNKQDKPEENLDCNERILDEDIKEKQKKDISSVKLNLVHLYDLAKKSRHGHKDDYDIDYILVNGLYKQLNELLKLLLPDYDMTISDAYNCHDIVNNQLRDMIGLFKWFNNSALYRFPAQMRQELYNISPGRDNDNNFNANSFICSLYIVLEIYFKEKVYLLDIPVKSSKKKCDAISYIQMRLSGETLPSYLKSIKDDFYEKSIQNLPSSLGACALAWAGHVKDGKYTGSELKEILEIVGLVADYRSHGNNISFDLTNDYLFQLRDNVLSKIKDMEEYEYGK